MTLDYKLKLLPWALFILCLGYIFVSKSNNAGDTIQKVKITVPAIVGKFDKTKPDLIQYDTVFEKVIKYKDKTVIVENAVNVEMAKQYLKAKDSIAKLNLFIDAIQIRRYKQSFDDNNVNITVEAETTGKLNWMKPTYVVKEKEIVAKVKPKETVFALYTGFSVGNNIQLNATALNAKIGLQNKKGSILTVEYGVLDKTYHVGYLKRIINYKK